jgi:large subunit ribosomal protein L23
MDILLKPIITEKMTGISEKLNKVGFIVNRKANKVEIAKAVEAEYGVTVNSVNTSIGQTKAKVRHTKTGSSKVNSKTYKKAIVTLAEGDTIDFYANI